MATSFGPTEAGGLFKEVYGDIDNLLPDFAIILKAVKFIASESENGKQFNEGVIVTRSQGFTYAPANSSNYTLNNPVSMVTQMAQVAGSQITLAEQVDWGTIARSNGQRKAFQKATSLVVENMLESASQRLEISALYGQTGVGTAQSRSNVNTTTTVITVTTAQWASGIWTGSKGAVINFTGGGNWIGSGTAESGDPTADDLFSISTVDCSARTLRITGTTTGISNLDTYVNANPGTAVIWFNGTRGNSTSGYSEMAGFKKILTNTSTLFNIDAASYDLWQGNTYSAASGNMTLSKTLAATALAADRGLMEDVDMFVNTRTFSSMNSDQAALRQYDGDIGADGKNAFESLTFQGPTGLIKVRAHPFVKEGDAFILPLKKVLRPGACNLQFYAPGTSETNVFFPLQSSNGYGIRLYTNQAIFLKTPARGVYVSGIVN